MSYSITVTYILWLFFGWLGIHHLYLGRLNHAIVWVATLGGGCGVGWLRDLWRIPSYVAWANADFEIQRRHLMRMYSRKYPACSIFKFVGFFVMGYLAAVAFSSIIPHYSEDDWRTHPIYYLICHWSSKTLYIIGGVLGVYLVANIGETSCSLKTPFMGCIYSLPLVYLCDGNVTVSPLAAGLTVRFIGLQWRQLPANHYGRVFRNSNIYNWTVYSTWLALICIGLYFNGATVVVNDGRIQLHVDMGNFFNKSDAWIRTRDSLYQLYNIYLMAGLNRMYKDLKDLFDLSGKGNAFRTLGLSKSASQAEINKMCRRLSKKYHPDRQKDPEEKIKAQEKFIEIQTACSTLSAVRSRRAKTCRRSEDRSSDPFRKRDKTDKSDL